MNIVNQGSAASISRIARLDYPDDVFGYELQFLEFDGDNPLLEPTEKTGNVPA